MWNKGLNRCTHFIYDAHFHLHLPSVFWIKDRLLLKDSCYPFLFVHIFCILVILFFLFHIVGTYCSLLIRTLYSPFYYYYSQALLFIIIIIIDYIPMCILSIIFFCFQWLLLLLFLFYSWKLYLLQLYYGNDCKVF